MTKAEALLRNIIRHMNTHELDELSVHLLSAMVGLSRWQVQRTFTALTGLTLSEHLRCFRLSHAAQRLVQTDTSVIDIAIECGFGSQAAFARAFKSHFKTTPGHYRKQGLLNDVSFQLFVPENKTWSKAMNIKIETKPAMTLIGMMDYFNGHGMPDANNFEIIPKLWERFNGETLAQTTNVPQWFGYIYESDDESRGALRYLASYDEREGPVTLSESVTEAVPEQQYAIVPHHGPLENIGETLDAFFGQWLLESDYKMASNMNIEMYDDRFNPASEENYFETWVPVKKLDQQT